MIDKARKRELYIRLRGAGLDQLGQAMMNVIRKEMRNEAYKDGFEPTTRKDPEIAGKAWEEAWRQLEPLCETIENLKKAKDQRDEKVTKLKQELTQLRKELTEAAKLIEKPKPTPKTKTRTFAGHKGDPTKLVDPDYSEQDTAKRFSDAYTWAAEQFGLVVSDSKLKTTVDFSKATSKPPNVLAIQLVEQHARAEPGSSTRIGLFSKAEQRLGKPRQPSAKTLEIDEDEYVGRT